MAATATRVAVAAMVVVGLVRGSFGFGFGG